jgi:uncharacterized protein
MPMTRVLFVAAIALLSCRSEGKAPKPDVPMAAAPPVIREKTKPVVADVTDETFVFSPALPHARISILVEKAKPILVDAEVAFKANHRTRGLMWRKQLPEGTGMLFIFPNEEPLSFWMRNTLIPLDMIFIGADRKVVNVVSNAEPKTLVGRPSTGPALYVLEVPGGWAQKVQIKSGTKMEFEGVEALAVE